jgi:hypothetical protein
LPPALKVQIQKRELEMATTVYFEETVKCQGGNVEMDVEFGRSSFYDEDSIYLNVDGKSLVMDRATAKKFVKAACNVGHYFGFID